VWIRSVLASTTPVVMDVSKGFDASALPDSVATMGRGGSMRRRLLRYPCAIQVPILALDVTDWQPWCVGVKAGKMTDRM